MCQKSGATWIPYKYSTGGWIFCFPLPWNCMLNTYRQCDVWKGLWKVMSRVTIVLQRRQRTLITLPLCGHLCARKGSRPHRTMNLPPQPLDLGKCFLVYKPLYYGYFVTIAVPREWSSPKRLKSGSSRAELSSESWTGKDFTSEITALLEAHSPLLDWDPQFLPRFWDPAHRLYHEDHHKWYLALSKPEREHHKESNVTVIDAIPFYSCCILCVRSKPSPTTLKGRELHRHERRELGWWVLGTAHHTSLTKGKRSKIPCKLLIMLHL